MSSAMRLLAHPSFLLGVAAFAVLFSAGAAAVVWVRRWRRRTMASSSSVNEDLAQYQRLREQGQLTDAEYQRIASQLRENHVSPSNDGSSG